MPDSRLFIRYSLRDDCSGLTSIIDRHVSSYDEANSFINEQNALFKKKKFKIMKYYSRKQMYNK